MILRSDSYLHLPCLYSPAPVNLRSQDDQQFSLWRRSETLSSNFVGYFVEKCNLSQNSSTKCLDKVGDEDTRTAIMRTAARNSLDLGSHGACATMRAMSTESQHHDGWSCD